LEISKIGCQQARIADLFFPAIYKRGIYTLALHTNHLLSKIIAGFAEKNFLADI